MSGFELGSSAWHADVLDQARLQPHRDINQKEEIINTLIKLRSTKGTKDETIKCIGDRLTKLAQKGNLKDPIQIGLAIANLTNPRTNKPATNDTKNKYAYAYKDYCEANGITWKKPYYRVEEGTPLIPTQQNVQAIIDNSSRNYATTFTIEAEIGCSPEELYQVTQKDIDKEKGEIAIK